MPDGRRRSAADGVLYSEALSSNWTEALFVALTLLFGALAIGRVSAGAPDAWAAVLFGLSALLLFYSVNYRVPVIRLNADSLRLTFGVFTWAVPLEDVEGCRHDDLPALMRYGGAGIHFMFIGRRYRASFNFLEHPRVVIALRRKAGPVRDVSFSTRRPDEVMRRIREAVLARGSARHGARAYRRVRDGLPGLRPGPAQRGSQAPIGASA